MRKLRAALRWNTGIGRSSKEMSAILGVSHTTVDGHPRRDWAAESSWPGRTGCVSGHRKTFHVIEERRRKR